MLTTERERRAMVAQHGQYVKEKCDRCERPLQQGFVYRAIGVTDSAGSPAAPERGRLVFCSLECQERAYYGNEKYERMKAKRQTDDAPALPKCIECGGPIPKFKKAESKFCSKRCRQKNSRENPKVAEIRSASL
jgi:hypothetical protein